MDTDGRGDDAFLILPSAFAPFPVPRSAFRVGMAFLLPTDRPLTERAETVQCRLPSPLTACVAGQSACHTLHNA
jgi:hypothetical protein